MSDDAIAHTFAAVPRTGVYERDLLTKMVKQYPQSEIEVALAVLSGQGFIKKAGCSARPIYVRMKTPAIVRQFLQENAT